jgi:hypothetical protein
MALTDWFKAFAFSDNPFDPSQPLRGMANADRMQDLARSPLPVHQEPKLEELFCPAAGAFAEYLMVFVQRAALAGYRPGIPLTAKRSLLFLIKGPRGTGKTTLANVMVERLQRGQPPGSWLCLELDESGEGFESPAEQRTALDALRARVKGDNPAYCCVLLDDLFKENVLHALRFYAECRKGRGLVLILLTSDLALIRQKNWDDYKVKFEIFTTQELTPDQAVEFVKWRVQCFRQQVPPNLAAFSLFPFEEQDLREHIRPLEAADPAAQRPRDGSIPLRQLGSTLDRALLNCMDILPADFDITKVPSTQVGRWLIYLAEALERMVA